MRDSAVESVGLEITENFLVQPQARSHQQQHQLWLSQLRGRGNLNLRNTPVI